MADKSNIHLYSGPTPNGIKVSILLEELGLKYDVSELPWRDSCLNAKQAFY